MWDSKSSKKQLVTWLTIYKIRPSFKKFSYPAIHTLLLYIEGLWIIITITQHSSDDTTDKIRGTK